MPPLSPNRNETCVTPLKALLSVVNGARLTPSTEIVTCGSVVAGSLQGLVFAAIALVSGRKLTPDIEDRVIDGEVIEAPEEADASRVGQLKLPFGPFLALGALEYLLAGDAILSWYFGLLQR